MTSSSCPAEREGESRTGKKLRESTKVQSINSSSSGLVRRVELALQCLQFQNRLMGLRAQMQVDDLRSRNLVRLWECTLPLLRSVVMPYLAAGSSAGGPITMLR